MGEFVQGVFERNGYEGCGLRHGKGWIRENGREDW
jgi:hypothetical protein